MPFRDVRESHVAMRVIDAEIKKDQNLIELYEGLTWRLARQPEAGYAIPGTDPQEYVIHSYHWPGFRQMRQLVIAYTFDDDLVVIWSVHVLD